MKSSLESKVNYLFSVIANSFYFFSLIPRSLRGLLKKGFSGLCSALLSELLLG
jgi:hypothetical protein